MPFMDDTNAKKWEQLDDLLHRIKKRAGAIRDNQLIHDADLAIGLLSSLPLEPSGKSE